MKSLIVAVTAGLAGVALVVSLAFAQHRGSEQGPGMGLGMQNGMMDMMKGCPMMSGNRAQRPAGELIPQLPPGNEKLQAQMSAEILQKVGEIASKYAAQAK